MERSKIVYWIATLILLIALTACGGKDNEATKENDENETKTEENMGTDHAGMNMHGSGEVPEGLKKEQNPKYEVGSEVIINADHMPGMKGAKATISGAYNTTIYALTYTPTNGSERVPNHKWVIHEELENPGNPPLKPGTEVIINANHMEGMDGAIATIDSFEQTTVYMVDFVPTTGGEKVTNHKWVTESELSPTK